MNICFFLQTSQINVETWFPKLGYMSDIIYCFKKKQNSLLDHITQCYFNFLCSCTFNIYDLKSDTLLPGTTCHGTKFMTHAEKCVESNTI